MAARFLSVALRSFLRGSLLALSVAGPATEAVGAQTSSSPSSKRDAWFRDLSEQYGVLFKHAEGLSNYSIGSGSVWFDMDLDGDEDLFVQSSVGESALYRRDGSKFTDVIAGSGIVNLFGNESFGASVADYDGNGLPDLYLCNFDRNTFFVNLGGAQFQESAIPLGMTAGHAWSTSSSWADFDLDGDLDLYVGNYIRQFNFPYHFGAPNALLENRGPGASPMFADVAAAVGADDSGVFGPSLPGFSFVSPEGQPTAGCTLATLTLDWDEDGDPDLQVGNDFGQWVLPNALLRNDQSGGAMAFTNVSSATGFDTRPHYNMGIFPADYDHDGDWDFYCTNLGDNLLLRNDDGIFVDATYTAGPVSGLILRGYTFLKLSSWGVLFEDFDNDGWEDLVVVNGYIPAAGFIENEKRSPNHLWRNAGDGTFTQIEAFENGMAETGSGRSISKADVNGDGFLDYYLQNNGSIFASLPKDRSRLFVNSGLHEKAGHWLELDLRGRIGHPDALGARLDLTIGATTWKRQVLGDSIFLASSSRMVHFGLGAEDEIELLTIRWPSGIAQTLRGLPADQRRLLLEPTVTGEAILPIDYQLEHLTLAAQVRNHDTVDHLTTVLFEVRLASDGTLIFTDAATVPVAAGATQTIATGQTVAAGTYAALQGLAVEVRSHVAAAGADDQDVDAQVLP